MKMHFVLIPKMPVGLRLFIFTMIVSAGLAYQYLYLTQMEHWFISILIIFFGTLFIMARHYKNKPLDLGFEDWKPVTMAEFERVKTNLAMTKSVTYPFIFRQSFGIFFLVLLGIAGFMAFASESLLGLVIVLNCFIIFIPPGFSGLVRLWTPAELKMKMERFEIILNSARKNIEEKKISITPYLRFDKDKEGRRIPEDIRFMAETRNKPDDFMGVQFQAAINNGPNGAVPYMYAVFLCKGQGSAYNKLKTVKYGNFIKEPGGDREYGYVVVRQQTSGGGYHTDPGDCERLYRLTEKVLELL